MMAEGLELVTVTEPMPPDLETGVVRQPARRSAKSDSVGVKRFIF